MRVTAPSRFASRWPAVLSASGTCAYVGGVVPEERREVGLSRRRGEQVVAAHDLVDALLGVVDDDRQVVGRHAVVAPQHDVVDRAGERAVQLVVDRQLADVGAEPERRRPLGRAAAPARRR